MRLTTAIDEFISHRQHGLDETATDRIYAVNTLKTYRQRLMPFNDWLAIHRGGGHGPRCEDFTAERVKRYLTWRRVECKRSLGTLNSDSTALREFAKWGVWRRLWTADSVTGIPAIRKKRGIPRPFTDAERDRLFAIELTGADDLVRALLYFAGLRESEAIGLRLRDIRPPSAMPDGTTLDGSLRVRGKGDKERVVDIHPALWVVLHPYLKSLGGDRPLDTRLFVKPDGSPWSNAMVEARFREWRQIAGVEDATSHRMRHTFATNYLDANPDKLGTLRDLLGHTSISTTEGYAKVSNRGRAESVSRVSVPNTMLVRNASQAEPGPVNPTGAAETGGPPGEHA